MTEIHIGPDMTSDAGMHRAFAFGLRWVSDLPLDRFSPSTDGQPADVVVRACASQRARRTQLLEVNRGVICADGVRFTWEREAHFDMMDGKLIEYCPGPDWAGHLPLPLFSTLTALLLAWRGAIPLHGSAVEIDGRAVLICGPAGAGKSTLAAGLLAHGGRLVSDDLSVVDPPDAKGIPMLRAGRPTMRLYPGTAAYLDAESVRDERSITDGEKIFIRPASVPATGRVPLSAVLLLGENRPSIDDMERADALQSQLFRPVWMSKLPHGRHRTLALERISEAIPVMSFPCGDRTDAATFHRRADDALRLIGSLPRQSGFDGACAGSD